MVKTIFFATLVIFPFGQLLKIGFVNLFDVLILSLAIITLFQKPKYPEWYKYFVYFLLSCVIGLLLNSSLFTVHSSLYPLRLWSYSMVAIYVFNYFKKPFTVHRSLITIAVASALFGWLQYLIWPDLTALKYLGWDDHLLRMVGTFLDPTYLGLILVLGSIIALQKRFYLAFVFLAFSLLFTYSRSSYLVLFFVFLFDFVKNKKMFRFLLLNSIFLLLFFLPKNIGEGTTLTRTVSANSKLINYQQTYQIFKTSPLFGVGFNNICKAREIYLLDQKTESHACNGADSSILFILATTGVIGFLLFLSFVSKLPTSYILVTSFLVILLHSSFANSLFYPHIMFWLFTLVGLGGKINNK